MNRMVFMVVGGTVHLVKIPDQVPAPEVYAWAKAQLSIKDSLITHWEEVGFDMRGVAVLNFNFYMSGRNLHEW